MYILTAKCYAQADIATQSDTELKLLSFNTHRHWWLWYQETSHPTNYSEVYNVLLKHCYVAVSFSFYWRCLTLLMLMLEGLHRRYFVYDAYALYTLLTLACNLTFGSFTVGIWKFALWWYTSISTDTYPQSMSNTCTCICIGPVDSLTCQKCDTDSNILYSVLMWCYWVWLWQGKIHYFIHWRTLKLFHKTHTYNIYKRICMYIC